MAATPGSVNSRTDAYIKRAEPFARPILTHLRRLVHQACPGVVETIKWGVPHFDRKGVICGLAGFKQHVRLVMWKGPLLHQAGLLQGAGADQFGKITSLKDLPGDKVLLQLFKSAARLNEDGVRVQRAQRPKKPPVKVPTYVVTALRKNKKSLAAFNAFPPSHKREYVEWITGAKTDETRRRRIDQAIRQIAEGKPRHWKYQR